MEKRYPKKRQSNRGSEARARVDFSHPITSCTSLRFLKPTICDFVSWCIGGFSLVGTLSLLLVACTPTGTPIYTLGTPRFVPQSQPQDTVETGIEEDSKTGRVFLQWFGTKGAAGYNIWRSDTLNVDSMPISFHNISNAFSRASDTSGVDNDPSIKTYTRYYYYVTAYAPDQSITSKPSDTAHIILLPQPLLRSPGINDSVSAVNLYFNWTDYTGGGATIIRLEDISEVTPFYVWISKDTLIYGGTVSTAKFNFDNTAGQLQPGHYYQWRVDIFVPNHDSQGKSAWQKFKVKSN